MSNCLLHGSPCFRVFSRIFKVQIANSERACALLYSKEPSQYILYLTLYAERSKHIRHVLGDTFVEFQSVVVEMFHYVPFVMAESTCGLCMIHRVLELHGLDSSIYI